MSMCKMMRTAIAFAAVAGFCLSPSASRASSATHPGMVYAIGSFPVNGVPATAYVCAQATSSAAAGRMYFGTAASYFNVVVTKVTFNSVTDVVTEGDAANVPGIHLVAHTWRDGTGIYVEAHATHDGVVVWAMSPVHLTYFMASLPY